MTAARGHVHQFIVHIPDTSADRLHPVGGEYVDVWWTTVLGAATLTVARRVASMPNRVWSLPQLTVMAGLSRTKRTLECLDRLTKYGPGCLVEWPEPDDATGRARIVVPSHWPTLTANQMTHVPAALRPLHDHHMTSLIGVR